MTIAKEQLSCRLLLDPQTEGEISQTSAAMVLDNILVGAEVF